MKVCKKENSVLYKNSNECHNMEYPLGDPDINVSVATVNGKYPETGYCINLEVKELLYIMEGAGKLIKKDIDKYIKLLEYKAKEIEFWGLLYFEDFRYWTYSKKLNKSVKSISV